MKNRTSGLAPHWSRQDIDAAIAVLWRASGQNLAVYDKGFLSKALESRRLATGCASALLYTQRLADDLPESQALTRLLNINYSIFFRNPLSFALLGQIILPELADAQSDASCSGIRVWCAGCAAGQEAWSLAILLADMAEVRACPIPHRIIATDFSSEALALAEQGVYDPSELQNVPLKYVQRYFSRRGDSCAISPALRASVDFSFYDLLDESSSSPAASIYGDFDLVLCSNLLFYYSPEMRQRILDKVCGALSPGGYLMTGEAERAIVGRQHSLRPVTHGAPIFRKQGAAPSQPFLS